MVKKYRGDGINVKPGTAYPNQISAQYMCDYRIQKVTVLY